MPEFVEKGRVHAWLTSDRDDDAALEKQLHRTIHKVTGDIDRMAFNTAIAAMMIFVNEATKNLEQLSRGQLLRFVQLLQPFAPHLGEELWERLGGEGSLSYATWPSYDEAMLVDDEVEIKLAASMEDAPKSVFKGWVIGLEVFGSGSSRRLVVRAIDAARDLMNGPAPSAHANTSFANVLKQLVSKVGSLSTQAHKSLNATQPYIAVTGTPMEFADNLCRRFGLSWWVDVAGRKLHLDRIQEPGDTRSGASATYRS